MNTHNRFHDVVSRNIPGTILRGLLLTAVCAIILVSLSGCGETASEKAKNIGKQGIEAVDAYLDGNATYKATSEKLDSLYSQLSYVNDMDQDDKNFFPDFEIQTDFLLMKSALGIDGYRGNAESYDNLIESRNNLAGHIGAKKR